MWTHKSETAPNLSIRRPVNNPFTILFRLFFLFHTTMYTHTLHQGLHTVRLHIGSFYHFPQKNEKKKKKVFPSWAHCVSAYAPLWLTDLKKKKEEEKKKLLGLLLCVSSLFFRVPVYLFLSYNNKAPLCFHTHLTIEKENSFFFYFIFSLCRFWSGYNFTLILTPFQVFSLPNSTAILYDSADVYNTI